MQDDNSHRVLKTIERIYEWVDTGSSQNSILEATGKLLGSRKVALLQLSLIDGHHVMIAMAGLTPEAANDLLDSIDEARNFLAHYRGWDQGNVYDSRRLELLCETRPNAGFDGVLATHDLEGGAVAGVITRERTSCIVACYYRGADDRSFVDEDLACLAELLPHWRRAISLKNRLNSLDQHTQATHRILDHAPFLIMLVDAAGFVLYQNYLASVGIGNDDGFTVRDGRLRLNTAEARRKFTRLLRSADEQGQRDHAVVPDMMAVERPSGSKPFQLMVLPVQCAAETGLATGPTYAVFIYDPTVSLPIDANSLCTLEGLTQAEANLCESLYRTKNLSQTAEYLDVSISTAKTHLLNTFRKLGINSQAELMKYLAHMPKISLEVRH